MRRRRRIVEGAARATDSRLPSLHVFIHGRLWRDLITRSPATGWYDFEPDVRELACEPIRGDVYAEWSDPREQWRPVR